MADDTAPPPVSTPYLVTQPDGSTATYYLHTDRPPTVGEVADYAESQRQTFAGFPEGPQAPPRPEAERPVPQLRAAPPEAPPTLGQQAWNVVRPQRTFISEWPSVAGAIPAATYGAEVGSAFGPVGTAVGGVTGAIVGGMGGEAAQIGLEHGIGTPPAEPGTFGQRVVGAGLRTGAGEVVGIPFRAAPQVAYGVVRPAAEAAAELEPILTGTAATVAPKGAGAAQALTPRYLLPRWWQENAVGKSPADVVQAWNALGADGQAAIAGEHLPAMNTIIGTLHEGSMPWSQVPKAIGVGGWGGLGGAAPLYYFGFPKMAGASLAYGAKDVLAPKLLAEGLMSPTRGVPFLAGLPQAAQVAGPIWGVTTRAGGQAIAGTQWPPAAQLVE
jgi:hypothetical protein